MDEKVKSLILNNGNNLHCRVLNEFRSRDWETIVSPYYLDEISNKPREIDIIAEKSFLYEDRFSEVYGTINAKLFIECKYIKQTVIFWFEEKNMDSAKNWILSKTPINEDNVFFKDHSYIQNNRNVAKLFTSESKSNHENDPIYKALNQSLHSMVYLRNKEPIKGNVSKRFNNILSSFSYPVIICNSFENFYRVDMNNQHNIEKIKDNFQLEVNYAYKNINRQTQSEYFLIDVVSIENIDDYLKVIESDVNIIKNFVE